MPLVPMRQILDEAAKGGYGVGAFNVNNMEQIQAIMQAAHETQSPVIIQASRGALKYSKMIYLRNLIQAAVEENPDIPVAMHLDHGNSVETVQAGHRPGLHLGHDRRLAGRRRQDAQHLRSQRRRSPGKSSRWPIPLGVSVEGELGCLGGIEDGHGAGLAADDANST